MPKSLPHITITLSNDNIEQSGKQGCGFFPPSNSFFSPLIQQIFVNLFSRAGAVSNRVKDGMTTPDLRELAEK